MGFIGSVLIIVTASATSIFFCGCSPDGPTPAIKPRGISHHHGDHEPHGNHTGNSTLIVKVKPAEFRAGEPVTLELMIHGSDGSMVTEFETVHEKQVHLIIVREGLDQFAHIHPEIDKAGNMTAPFAFPVGGKYFLYADHKPAGEMQATAVANIRVPGDAPAPRKLTPNVPGAVKGDNITAKVSVGNARAGGSSKLSFSLTDQRGKPIADLEPYLGAMGHLVVISADGKQYVHAHPLNADKATSNTVEFEAHFPTAGLYKGWGQFQRGGKVFTMPFVIEVP